MASIPGTTGSRQDIYRIRFECVGDGKPTVLRLFVNDTFLGDATDPDGLAAGRVGLYSNTFAQPQSDVRFDNFRVTRPT